MADERINIRIKLDDAAKFVADAKAAGHEIEVLGNKADRAGSKGRSMGMSFDLVQRTIKLVKPAALIAGLGLLTQVLSASAAGGIGLVSALTPLLGLMGALPAAGLGAAQAIGVLALAFSGISAAVGGLNAQMDPKKFMQLTAPAQNFALTLDGLKGRVRGLQSSVQAGLFPGLTSGLVAAAPALDALKGPLTGTGRVLGSLGDRLGHLVGSRGFMKDLASQARFNNVQIGRLGGAGLHLVNILRNLSVAARPLVSWMVRLVSGWAASADASVALGRQTGSLGRMFHSTQVTLSRLVRIGGDLGATFFNIARIGKHELGDSLLVSLVRGSDALHKWSDSGPGIAKITKYFRDAKPVVYATARLFKDISLEFLKFGAGGPGLAGLIDKLDRLVPVLGNVVGGTATAFGPVLIDAVSSLARAFAPLAGTSGPLVLFVRALTGMADAAVYVEQHVPGATTVLTGLFGTLAVIKTLGMASFVSQLFGMGRGLKTIEALTGKGGRGFSVIRAGVLEVGVIKSGVGGLGGGGESTVSKVLKGAGLRAAAKTAGGLALETALPAAIIGGLALHNNHNYPTRGPGAAALAGTVDNGQGASVLNRRSSTGASLGSAVGAALRRPVRRPSSGPGDSMPEAHTAVTVMPQPIYLDGKQIGEVTADVAVKHQARQ